MLVSYSDISNKSKIWIYPSSRIISSIEQKDIQDQLSHFCSSWKSHNHDVMASFKVCSHCICLFVDENTCEASGCSIDQSVALIKSISRKYNIDFFNRFNIAYIDNDIIKILHLNQFKLLIKPGIIIYNNMIKNKLEFESKWRTPVEDTWLNKLLG